MRTMNDHITDDKDVTATWKAYMES